MTSSLTKKWTVGTLVLKQRKGTSSYQNIPQSSKFKWTSFYLIFLPCGIMLSIPRGEDFWIWHFLLAFEFWHLELLFGWLKGMWATGRWEEPKSPKIPKTFTIAYNPGSPLPYWTTLRSTCAVLLIDWITNQQTGQPAPSQKKNPLIPFSITMVLKQRKGTSSHQKMPQSSLTDLTA